MSVAEAWPAVQGTWSALGRGGGGRRAAAGLLSWATSLRRGRRLGEPRGLSRLPLELLHLRCKFPGSLLNFNFECSSGQCLCFLPVPHFPLPTPGQ